MKNCLVVDDSRVVRKVARRMLEEMAFEVREAEDGKQALLECEKLIPDFILLDWNMPVMSGFEFLIEFRKNTPSSRTKVVFCTTENEMEKIFAAMNEGADEFIMKPFDSDILKSKLIQVGLLEE